MSLDARWIRDPRNVSDACLLTDCWELIVGVKCVVGGLFCDWTRLFL